MKTVLIIAGSDPGAGAGLQQDLKTATLLGTYGFTVASALTVQNSRGLQAVHPVAPEVVAAQLDAVLSDFPVHAIKIGMLATAANVRAVAARLKKFLGGGPKGLRPGDPFPNNTPIILDPVLAAGQGGALLEEEGIEAMQAELFPLTHILTPNVPEAARLRRMEIKTPAHLEDAARRLQALGPQWVLAKGGHLEGDPVDVLTDGKNAYHLPGARIIAPHNHGSGCLLATALAAHLARGLTVPEAVNRARDLVRQALQYGLPLGQGVGAVNPYAPFAREAGRYGVLRALKEAGARLVKEDISLLIPEAMSNLGYAAPYPAGPEDVAAFPGRILKTPTGVLIPAAPWFGAAARLAALILAVQEQAPHLRAAMNIIYPEGLEELAPKLHLNAATFRPSQAPPAGKGGEADTLAGAVAGIMRGRKEWEPPPDLLCDPGGVGREPMIWILGESPMQVAEKALALKNAWQTAGRL